MRKGIDFNEELRKWFEGMLDAALREDPAVIKRNSLFLDEVNHDLVQIVYDCLRQQTGQVKLTAAFFGIDPKTVYNYIKKKPKG